jgi:hypothetical protein
MYPVTVALPVPTRSVKTLTSMLLSRGLAVAGKTSRSAVRGAE